MVKYFYTFLVSILCGTAVIAQPVKQAVIFFKKGLQLEEKGMFNEAIIAFKKAVALNKKYDSAYLQMGMLYAKISKPDSAVLTLKNAVKANPSFAPAYTAMGTIYRDYIKNMDAAIISYTGAYTIDSTDKIACYNLAWCYNAKENYREAIKYAIKSLEADNNYKPAYNELGHAYRQLKAYDECIVQLKKNLAISVNEIPLLYTAYCYIELQQKDNALKIHDELNKLNPKMATILKKKIDAMQ